MLTIETKLKVSEYFKQIAENERQVEIVRQILTE